MGRATELTAAAVRAAMSVLEEASEPLPFRVVWAGVNAREPHIAESWDREFPGIKTTLAVKLRYESITLVKAGWLRKHNRTWALTRPGLMALAAHSDANALFAEAGRRYRHWSDNREAFDEVERLLKLLEQRGGWVSITELSELVRLDPYLLLEWLQGTHPKGWRLVLDPNGNIPVDPLGLTEREYGEWADLVADYRYNPPVDLPELAESASQNS